MFEWRNKRGGRGRSRCTSGRESSGREGFRPRSKRRRSERSYRLVAHSLGNPLRFSGLRVVGNLPIEQIILLGTVLSMVYQWSRTGLAERIPVTSFSS